MSLDLNKLANKLDEALSKETSETLNKFLTDKRMSNNKQIKNGDVFDIGQTVNGVSKFLWFNNTWYYFEERMSWEYEYDQSDLTKLVLGNEFEEVTFIKNIFDNEQ